MERAGGGSKKPNSATTRSATVKRGIDTSVGSLLWVRRRNGSWWPGQILAPDEVSHVVFPRPGTPVKLLGRDDGSIDWYNLEKSKRIKAFRCEEYNQCIAIAIARAEAVANPSKKRVNYARREDAIIHALELESAHLGRDHPDHFSRTDNSEEDMPRSLDKKSRSIDNEEDNSEEDMPRVSGLLENDSFDRSFDVPVIGEENPSEGFSHILCSLERHQNGGSRGQDNQNSQHEAPFSKWLSKGKRKSRHKRKNRNEDSILDGSSHGFGPGVDGIGLYDSISPREPLHLVRPQRSLPFRQSHFTVNSRYHSQEYLTGDFCTYSRLYDVRLDVKPSNRPHDVPSVTLVSKLNAKPIIGHPLTVEVLANGYCNQLMHNIESDEKYMSVLVKKWNSIFKTRIPARRARSKPRYSGKKKAKLSKATILSRKIRKLSSLTGQKQSKTFPDKPPNRHVTACVPVKLVFNRINVAVNGSTPQTQRKFSSIQRSRILAANIKHGFFNSVSKVEPAPP